MPGTILIYKKPGSITSDLMTSNKYNTDSNYKMTEEKTNISDITMEMELAYLTIFKLA